MKKILFAILSVFAMVACIKEELPGSIEQVDGQKVTLSFDVKVPELGSVTRAMGNETIQSLYVVVYDEAGYHVDTQKATLQDNAVPNAPATKKFTVTLDSSSNQRRIHFIAVGSDDNDPNTVDINAKKLIDAIEALDGQEDTDLYSLAAEGLLDAYWQRIVYEDGINKNSSDAFGGSSRVIPLIRNYARIKVSVAEDCDNFVLTGYKVYYTRAEGAVAAYDEAAGGVWVDFANSDLTPKTYKDLATYSPLEKGDLVESTAEATPGVFTYVRETKNDNKVSNHPFVVVEGTYNGNTYYYKLDFVYDNGGWANILRNFEYNFVINSVEKPGQSSYDDAADELSGENSLSYDMGTESFLNISDGTGQLFVNATTVVMVNGNQTFDLRYKYIPDVKNNPTEVANDQVTVAVGEGRAITAGSANAIDGSDWYSIIVDANEPPVDGRYEQTIRLSTTTGLARDVKFIVRAPYSLDVLAFNGETQDRTQTGIPVGQNKLVWVDVTIPADIDESLFPLEFVFETEDNTLSPDVSSTSGNKDHENNPIAMPVRTGQSIIPAEYASDNTSGNTFGFVYTLSKEHYDSLAETTTNGVKTKTFTAHFKTTTAASATTVWVDNLYFAKDAASASASFTNVKETRTENLQLVSMSNANYYGANQAVTVTIEAPGSGSTPLLVTLEFTGMKTTRATAEMTTTPIGNDQHTVTLYTADWSTTRTVTKVSCAAKIDTGLAEITYNPSANTNTLSSGTVNVLHIPAGSFDADNSGLNNRTINMYLGNTNTSLGRVRFNNDGTNQETTLTRTGLEETTELQLRYTVDGGWFGEDTTYAANSTTALDATSSTKKNISFVEQQ